MEKEISTCPCSTPSCENEGVFYYEDAKEYSCSDCEATVYSGNSTKQKIPSTLDVAKKIVVTNLMIKNMMDYIQTNYSEGLRDSTTESVQDHIATFESIKGSFQDLLDNGSYCSLIDTEEKIEKCLDDFKKNPEHINYLLHQSLAKIKTTEFSKIDSIERASSRESIPYSFAEESFLEIPRRDPPQERSSVDHTIDDSESREIPVEEVKLVEPAQVFEENKNYEERDDFVNHEVTRLSCELFDHAYDEYFEEEVEIGEDFKLVLNMDQEKDWKFLKFLLGHKIPNCKYLSLRAIPERKLEVKQFLYNSFPDLVRDLNFNFMSNRKDITFYQKSLEHIFPKVGQELNLYHLIISNQQLCRLLMANTNSIMWIGFIECKLPDQFDFGNKINGANFRGLSLSGSKYQTSNHWENHPERFRYLIEALSRVNSVRQSMDRIWLVDSGIELASIRNTLDSNGFENVEIKRHSI
ncbi:unnamed protein product [Moneuplotes crassus]|uniref:Uncharacterized protein n=1 Tax=Euplotes crassus TaxID=5936 RepID=A0AAD1UPU7_EUPCR|nr:unnamed protein product [Moneuplotes crassus]